MFVSIDNSFKEFCYKGEKTKEVLTGKIEVSRFFCLLLSLDEKNVCQWLQLDYQREMDILMLQEKGEGKIARVMYLSSGLSMGFSAQVEKMPLART